MRGSFHAAILAGLGVLGLGASADAGDGHGHGHGGGFGPTGGLSISLGYNSGPADGPGYGPGPAYGYGRGPGYGYGRGPGCVPAPPVKCCRPHGRPGCGCMLPPPPPHCGWGPPRGHGGWPAGPWPRHPGHGRGW